MQSTYLYVVMSESYDGYTCTGSDIFYSLDPDLANDFLHNQVDTEDMTWYEDDEMYRYQSKFSWEKMYVDMRPLNEEL